MLYKYKSLKYLLVITSLSLMCLGFVMQQSKFNDDKNIHQNINEKFKELCDVNQQNLNEYIKNKKTKGVIISTINNEVNFWNNNEVIIDEILLKDEGLIKTKNSWNLVHKKTIGDTCIYAVLKIKQVYPFENNFLENYFNDNIKLSKDVQISEASEKDKIYFTVENKKFKLTKLNSETFYSEVYIILELLGVFSLLLFLILIGNKIKPFSYIIIVILARIILSSDITLIHLKETILFNPNIFAWNLFVPSLADLIIHFIFLNIVSVICKNKYIQFITFTTISALLISASHTLIIHSDISLELEKIIDIPLYGWLIIILFTIQIVLLSNYLSNLKNYKLFIIYIILVGIINLAYNKIGVIITFGLLISLTYFIVKNKYLKTIVLVLLLSFDINYNLSTEIDKKNTQKIENSLEKKSEKRNIITEYLITDIMQEIAGDKNSIIKGNKIKIKSYINKLPGEFEFNLGKCYENETCLSEEKNNTIIEENSNFKLYYNLSSSKEYYTAIIPIENSKYWITLKENKKDDDYGFPILLANPKMQSYYFNTKGSYAKYQNNHLIYSDGKYNFPKKYKYQNRFVIYNTGEITHVFVDLENKKNKWWIGAIYLFIICLIIHYLYQLIIIQKALTQNFRFKIQFSILILIIFSVGIIAIGSIYIQKKQQTQNLQKNLLSNVTLIGNNIENKISVVNKLDDLQYEYLQKLIETLGENYTSDINLYSTEGYLKNTTREKIYDKGILSKYIHPIPFNKILFNDVKSYIHMEQIGKKLNYFSAYHGVFNDQKKLIGIIQIPYFTETKDFNNDINEYILSIINIYILLIIITLITGYIIAQKITQPLKILSNNLQNLQINNLNQHLKWETNDEIGQLIQQYNITLEKLESNVKKLAQKERESAWREMAQQVAHEIKNPLTPMKLSMQHFLMRWDDMDEETKNDKFKSVAKNMIEQMDQLAAIASDFSSFAKINEGKKETILLDEVLNNVISVFNTNDIIEYVNENNHSYVNGNKNELNRVFTNILQNAIQAVSDQVKPQIYMHKKFSNQFVEITIRDNGNGIPLDIQDKIFIPKFTTKNSGSGLGLAMVKQIVDFHEGKISFETSTNGTTFTILLPKI
jgi:two-component system nitrogen regulation sensor histidine kinase NtrY